MTEPPYQNEKRLLEICIASLDDLLVAQSSGADRVELNSALLLGGLTPSPGCVELVMQATQVPVVAMARPRESGFCYSDREFSTLLRDVNWLAKAGVDGIAFGVLDDRGQIDRQRCEQVVAAMGPQRQAVFHRAFDLIEDQLAALEALIDCGVQRVMTSGGQPNAVAGQANIARLVERAAGRIEILAAGGIRSGNVQELLAATGVNQIHAGPSRHESDASYRVDCPVNFYGSPPQDPSRFSRSNAESIRDLAAVLTGPATTDHHGTS